MKYGNIEYDSKVIVIIHKGHLNDSKYLSIDFYGNSENLAILEKAKEEYERLVSFYEFFSDSDDDSFE